MNRRSLLKNLGVGAVAAVALPAWAHNWSAEKLPATPALKTVDETMLKMLVDTLIPKTETPGALELGVDQFVKAMVNTMHTAEEQKAFYDQLASFDSYAEKKYQYNFDELSAQGKVNCLKELESTEDEKMRSFYGLLKRYTVQGYTGSEWYMTEKAGYAYAPGYGHGCVDA
jgi:hypothetical protein